MIIAKGTIMLTVILLIWICYIRFYYRANPKAAFEFIINDNPPAWAYVLVVLCIVDVILIVVSVFWFLFLR